MKTAVVLLNLGGPDSLEAVRPFLFNLFNDKAIIAIPQPLRRFIASVVSRRRTPIATQIYEQMGGKSPIVEQTQAQASALRKELMLYGDYEIFTAMRYWHPFTAEIVAKVKACNPDRVVLLPLYPQYSTSTTQSSFDVWYDEAHKQGLTASHHPVCCYPFDTHFIDAHLALLREHITKAQAHGEPRILFSAHGLPERTIKKGDPYQWQVERTVSAIVRKLGKQDHVICYQSRVGPLKWIGPSTLEELDRAAKDKVPVIVVPVSFVSEHSETLVELDKEYKTHADEVGVPFYTRVPTVGTHPEFIKSLAWLCESTKLYPNCSNALGRQCPKDHAKCGFREWGKSR